MVAEIRVLKHKKGDRVRHPERPEWGIGEVTKVEILTRDGKPDRRVWIRFPSVGSKTVLASIAKLEPMEAEEIDGLTESPCPAGVLPEDWEVPVGGSIVPAPHSDRQERRS